MIEEVKEIFRSALKIAIENGHDIAPATLDQIMFGFDREPAAEMIYIPIIFSHSFAKAFFGKKWRDHLQRMILEEEPIMYIKQFLVENYKVGPTETPQ
ncbi:MAG: hypothetical protein A3C07_05120 [Candidatus Sungbacteria bacterium RIFCSPHIGHO2_02_FULL_47_11]|uniref:Uncharacterized protein n=1 Tax=Candidatus Sungbacteria bacterium RIFCSPHIGHO2_02_FULL_47_11 TaxID=1802270 RepID=A0A1G2KRE9_9BACT|nr:MAG: hypothetical protein A3C07_05120 [Candidatus Sungbacteria bacterium RIFCSPHIGHO2_02_FULL_47_11]